MQICATQHKTHQLATHLCSSVGTPNYCLSHFTFTMQLKLPLATAEEKPDQSAQTALGSRIEFIKWRTFSMPLTTGEK